MTLVDAVTYGEVFTRRWVADTILDLASYTSDRDLGAVRLLEPSCGSGAFLKPAVERLLESARIHDRDLSTLGDAVHAFDLLEEHVVTCRELCARLLTDAGLPHGSAVGIAAGWVHQADFLLTELDDNPFDVVVGNPPYIRYDDLSDDIAVEYRKRWGTMTGRGDIYVGFFERALQVLAVDGAVGFICADRWMRNQYGAALRDMVSTRFAVEQVWTMHDVDAFEAQVSAYPAITIIRNASQATVFVADTTELFGPESAKSLATAALDLSVVDHVGPGVTAHRLPHWFSGPDLWPTGTPARLELMELLNDRFPPLHDEATGTRVAIGIATGNDRAYVTKNFDAAEPDRMLPLAMRRDLMSGDFRWEGNYLVNPWTDSGQLVDLRDYPRLASHLSNSPELKNRFVVKRNAVDWFRTIDKVNASVIAKPKILIQDMKAHIHPVLEPGGHYPHHNLYYVTSETWDMEVLGGLLLSRVAQAFIEAYGVRMRGGTLRFQAQYLRRIRVPDQASIAPDIAQCLREAFRSRDTVSATRAAAMAYGIDVDRFELGESIPLRVTSE